MKLESTEIFEVKCFVLFCFSDSCHKKDVLITEYPFKEHFVQYIHIISTSIWFDLQLTSKIHSCPKFSAQILSGILLMPSNKQYPALLHANINT